jgi:hypothetical protein
MTTVTEIDRRALAHLLKTPPGEWAPTPPCFTPNALCRDQAARGLVEVIEDRSGVRLRLTEFGRAALSGSVQ